MTTIAYDVPLLQDDFPLPLDRPFTSVQASSAGLSRRTIRRLIVEGLLRSPIRGVLVAAQVPDSRELRGQVLELVCPPGSVVTDWTACWYWTGMDRPNAHVEEPVLSVFRESGRQRLRNGLVKGGERSFEDDDLVPLGGNLMVTSPIRTAWDLGRFFAPVVALGGMDALARHGSFGLDELCGRVERFKRQRGVVQLRVLAPMVDPRSESFGESALRLRWKETPGLPPPELQIPVLDASGAAFRWLDLGVPAIRFAAEYDGEEFHGPEQEEHDATRRDGLTDELGWHFEVFRRVDVFGPRQTVGLRLHAGIRQARRSLGLR